MEGGSGGQESVQSKRPSGGRLDRGRVIAVTKTCGTRPGSGLQGCRSCFRCEPTGREENQRGKVGKGRFKVEVRFLSFSLAGGGNFGSSWETRGQRR